jgi:hypothetical protein
MKISHNIREFPMSKLKLSTVVVMGLVLPALFTGCSRTATEKIADAKANVVVAKDAVADAQAAAREEWLKFKSEGEAKITANERIIAEYKVKMTTADGKLRAKYDQKIDVLEAKNKELKAKLDNYEDAGKSTWEKFKSEFNHDLDGVGAALADITTDNKK